MIKYNNVLLSFSDDIEVAFLKTVKKEDLIKFYKVSISKMPLIWKH